MLLNSHTGLSLFWLDLRRRPLSKMFLGIKKPNILWSFFVQLKVTSALLSKPETAELSSEYWAFYLADGQVRTGVWLNARVHTHSLSDVAVTSHSTPLHHHFPPRSSSHTSRNVTNNLRITGKKDKKRSFLVMEEVVLGNGSVWACGYNSSMD